MEDNCATAYIYLDYQDRKTQSAANVLSCLLKQLLRRFEPHAWPNEIFESLRAEFSDAHNMCTLTIRELTDHIFICAKHFSKVFIVIDALDECENPNEGWKLMRFLIAATQLEHVRLLITSRPQLSIDNALKSVSTILISGQKSDIETYIRSNIEYRRWRKELREEVVSNLVFSAEGL